MEYASDSGITASERLLWYALIHLMNARGEGSNWPDGFISISNKRLLSYLPYNEDTLIPARNRLKQRGLIDYEPGKRNAKSPMYKINYLTASQQLYPEKSGNDEGNGQGNAVGNNRGNMGDNQGGLYPDLEGTGPSAQKKVCSNEAYRTSARARAAVAQNILNQFKGTTDPGRGSDVHFDICEYLEKGLAPEVILQALGDCEKADYIPIRLHTAALLLGIDTENDKPAGF